MTGFIWNALGSTMYGLNSFVMLALVSRVGTVDQAGCFSIAFTTAQMLYILGVFGVSHYQMTDYAEKYRFFDYAGLRVFSSALMLLCCAGAILGLGFTGEKRIYTIALSILMLLNVIGELYQCLFFQKNRVDLSGSALFYRTLWSLVAFSVSLFLSRNILLAVIAQILVNLLATLYYAVRVAPGLITRNPPRQHSGVLALGRECFPLFISLLLMNLLINAPKYGIEFLLENTAQGYFSMIFMPVQVVNLCAQFIFRPMLGSYSAALQENRIQDFLRLLRRQLILVTGLTVFAALCAFLLGTPVLGILYSKDLSAFRIPLTVLIIGSGIYAACQLFYYIMVILRRQTMILGIYALSMVFAAAVTGFLVSAMGIMGAVMAFLVSHLLLLTVYAIGLSRCLKEKRTL